MSKLNAAAAELPQLITNGECPNNPGLDCPITWLRACSPPKLCLIDSTKSEEGNTNNEHDVLAVTTGAAQQGLAEVSSDHELQIISTPPVSMPECLGGLACSV